MKSNMYQFKITNNISWVEQMVKNRHFQSWNVNHGALISWLQQQQL